MRNSVLIYEESAVVREICVEVCEASGFEVDTVDDLFDAVDAMFSTDYSIIIVGDTCESDNMPISIRAAQRAAGKYAPIIGLREQGKQLPFSDMDDCVQTPLSINVLKQTIDRWFHYSLGRTQRSA